MQSLQARQAVTVTSSNHCLFWRFHSVPFVPDGLLTVNQVYTIIATYSQLFSWLLKLPRDDGDVSQA